MTEATIQGILRSHHAYEEVVQKNQDKLERTNKKLDAVDLHLKNSDLHNENVQQKLNTSQKKIMLENVEMNSTIEALEHDLK